MTMLRTVAMLAAIAAAVLAYRIQYDALRMAGQQFVRPPKIVMRCS